MYRTLLATVALAFSSVTASAETITVCASGCDYTSINAAIGAASDGDVIQLAAETYFEGEQIDTLGKAITLRGVLDKAGEPASVLDGAGTHRVLICQGGESAKTVFENLVIQNGRDNRGGGMYNVRGSSPTLSNCTFTSNLVSGTETSSGGRGGGMYNSFSSPTLTDCTFTINSASGGPFAGNDSSRGGGIYNSSSSPTLIDCTFTNNSASGSKVDGGSGGGMYNAQSSPSLTGCAFTSNLASGGKLGGRGGGMYNSASSPILTDCILCGNSPDQIDGPWNDEGSNCVMASCDDCELPSDPCPTDLDENGLTDGGDLGAFFIFWGECQFKGCPADFNDDNVVDGIDLGILFSAWGPCQ